MIHFKKRTIKKYNYKHQTLQTLFMIIFQNMLPNKNQMRHMKTLIFLLSVKKKVRNVLCMIFILVLMICSKKMNKLNNDY